MEFRQISQVENRPFRDSWIISQIKSMNTIQSSQTVLDVGAGEGPYRKAIEEMGFQYSSHDFNLYKPSDNEIGFQDPSWVYADHKHVCDVLEIPEDEQFDIVMCTEVFEHIPDPVAAFSKLGKLVKPNGFLIITVPISSHIHQAPFYFSSGLSPYWFTHWASRIGMSIKILEIHGDYLDRIQQDVKTLLNLRSPFHIPGLAKLSSIALGLLRPLVKQEVMQSSGFGTLFIGQKATET